MASGRSRPESHGGRSNSNQNRRTVGCVNLVTSSLAHKRSGGNGAAGPPAPTDSLPPAPRRGPHWPAGRVVPPHRLAGYPPPHAAGPALFTGTTNLVPP